MQGIVEVICREPLLKKELRPCRVSIRHFLLFGHADKMIPDMKVLGRKGRDLMKVEIQTVEHEPEGMSCT